MSTLNVIRPGLGNTNSYLTSGIPFVTSSVVSPALGEESLVIEFPQVTKFITVKNTTTNSHPVRIGFSQNGITGSADNNFFLLQKDESFTAELRVVDLHILSNDPNHNPTVTVIAGLTTIDRRELSTNWSGSAGVG